MSSPINRFAGYWLVGSLLLWLLAACAGYTASVLYAASAQEASALAQEFPAHWLSPAALPAAFAQLRGLLAGLALAFGLLGALLAGRLPPGTLSYPGGGRGVQRVWAGLLRGWWGLPPQQRRWALAGFFCLTALRGVTSWVGVNVDDIASYEYFVRKSLLTVIAYYPAPNNHLLSNAISWAFYQLYPGYWWSMRVPVLLLSTVGTAGWFLGLLRHTNFRVAMVTVTLFSFLQTSLVAAGLGRGYVLVMVCSGVGFFSMLLLSSPAGAGPASRRAWAKAGLVGAGVLGLYAVPTFAYFLVGAYSWLAVRWRRRPAAIAGLGVLGAATLLGAALLYAPLLCISGPGALFQNTYVKPLATTEFFQQLPAYSRQVEGLLLGESKNGTLAAWHVGALAAALVLAGFLGLVGLAGRGRLAGAQAAAVLRTGVPALWLALLPYALLVAQRVQPPDRTLGFKAVFVFLLLALEVDWLLTVAGARARALRGGLLLGAGLWLGVQVAQLYRSNELVRAYQKTPHLAAQWLLRQPPGPVLVLGSPWYVAYLRFYFHFEDPTSAVLVDDHPRAGIRYRYLVGSPAELAAAGRGRLRLHIPADLDYEAADIRTCW